MVELAQLEELVQKIENAAETMGEVADVAAGKMTVEAWKSAVKNTPVKTGYLKSGWSDNVNVEKSGNSRTITLSNNVEYAEYVENGHIQHPGQFVPGLGKDGKGRRLVKNFVEGAHMAKRAELHCKRVANQVVKQATEEALRKKVQE